MEETGDSEWLQRDSALRLNDRQLQQRRETISNAISLAFQR